MFINLYDFLNEMQHDSEVQVVHNKMVTRFQWLFGKKTPKKTVISVILQEHYTLILLRLLQLPEK